MTKTGLIWNLTNLNRCVVRNGQTSLSMAWVWAWWQIQNMATLLLGEFFAFLCKWKCLFKNVCLDVQRGVFSLLHLTNYALIMFFLQAVTSALRCRSEADWHLDGCLGTRFVVVCWANRIAKSVMVFGMPLNKAIMPVLLSWLLSLQCPILSTLQEWWWICFAVFVKILNSIQVRYLQVKISFFILLSSFS